MANRKRIIISDEEVEKASLPLLTTSLARAVMRLARLRRVDPRVIVEEAVFWYLNFISDKIDAMGRTPITLSTATADRIAEHLAELLADKIQVNKSEHHGK
jgi:hypothetical protein